MAAPKPGDRVMWNGAPWMLLLIDNDMAVLDPVDVQPRVPLSSISVVPPKVYVNSDTTEFKAGDVARLDPSGAAMVYSDDKCWHYLSNVSISASQPYPDEALTLLVRDGKPVQP